MHTVLCLLLWIPAVVISLIVAVLLVKEAIGYYHLMYYKKQGMAVNYVPILGWNVLFLGKKGNPDQLSEVKEFGKKLMENKVDICASNTHANLRNSLYLADPDIIQEFLNKELEVSEKIPVMSNVNFGFFWKGKQIDIKKR